MWAVKPLVNEAQTASIGSDGVNPDLTSSNLVSSATLPGARRLDSLSPEFSLSDHNPLPVGGQMAPWARPAPSLIHVPRGGRTRQPSRSVPERRGREVERAFEELGLVPDRKPKHGPVAVVGGEARAGGELHPGPLGGLGESQRVTVGVDPQP